MAFREKPSTPFAQAPIPPSIVQSTLLINREELKRALDGDSALMAKLISDWETDALSLELEGLSGVKRLSRQEYVHAQVLGRKLSQSSPAELATLAENYRLKYLVDDAGQGFSLDTPYNRFLPQTYVAASFLLSLTTPDSIVAIPKGLREIPHLYSPVVTDKIPLDVDRYYSEQLYQAKPEIAFVSHYSHPTTIQALQNQGIKLFTLSAIDSLSDIKNALIRVGNVINRPLEAELTALFLESALNAIDNCLLATKQKTERILFVNHMNQFSLPSSKTLTGQLLKRLGVETYGPKHNQAKEWLIPVDQEQIAHYEPDCMIIATMHEEATKKKIFETPAFSSLPATQNQRVYCVDETVQNFPSHYIALAYYDLARALASSETDTVSLHQTTASLP